MRVLPVDALESWSPVQPGAPSSPFRSSTACGPSPSADRTSLRGRFPSDPIPQPENSCFPADEERDRANPAESAALLSRSSEYAAQSHTHESAPAPPPEESASPACPVEDRIWKESSCL